MKKMLFIVGILVVILFVYVDVLIIIKLFGFIVNVIIDGVIEI